MIFAVTDVSWDVGKSRRAEVGLVDTAGNRLRLIDYDGAEISINWKQDHQYRISRCKVQKGGSGYDLELAPSSQTHIEPLGPIERSTSILVIGDTHVGRTKHPKNNEKIDPIEAFSTAVEYGIEQGVDAVIHVGDIFHDSATPVQAMLVDQHIFEPLVEAEIPFYYVRGNHAASPGDEILADRKGEWVSNIDTAGVSVGSEVRLFGIDHHPEGNLPWSDLIFPDVVSESISVLVVHQTLKQLSGPGPKSVDLDRIQRRFRNKFDFVVSGHHHDASYTEWRNVPVLYTGAAERMSKNANPVDRVAWLLTSKDGSVVHEQYDIP